MSITDGPSGLLPEQSKLRERMTNARLARARAAQYVRVFPAAQATPLVRDMQTALSGLIEEIEHR